MLIIDISHKYLGGSCIKKDIKTYGLFQACIVKENKGDDNYGKKKES
jgi:hypothetical protein